MKRAISIVSFAFACILFATGCVEHRYYVEHRDHSPGWYHHHPHRHPSVDINIHN